jgi:hypothetical protein
MIKYSELGITDGVSVSLVSIYGVSVSLVSIYGVSVSLVSINV